MFGNMCLPNVHEPGIVPLALTDLFTNARLKPGTCLIKLSYLEIYNEMVRDLLSSKASSRAQGLLLVEDPERGVIASDLTEYTVTSPQEVGKFLQEGNTRRTMAPTGANQFSSRSHAILQFSLEVHSESKESGRQVCSSKLCLIDLAGCERAAATANRGVRLFEGANINRSLLALGNCINILSDPEKAGRFVPYRDSKLTRLLKDALGGRTRTVMIACVSPTDTAFEETLHSLKYAERARRIKVSASRNIKEVQVHVSEYKAIIAALRAEVESLKEQIRLKDNQLGSASPSSPVLDGDSLDVELRRNFEEFWELKQSIFEVETLNEENKKQIKALVADLEYVQSINDAGEETRLKGEINRFHHTVRTNEEEIKTLLTTLQGNLKAKSVLHKRLSSLQTDRQLDILQLEITVRSLKMEKMDLYIQNQEMKQKMANSQKISEEKERTIVALRLEVEEMKKQMVGSSARLSEIDVRSEGVSPHDIDTSSSAHMHSSRQSSTSFTLVSPTDHSSPDIKPKSLFLSDLHQVRALRKFEKVGGRSESAESFVANYGTSAGNRGEEAVAMLGDVKEQHGDEEIDPQPIKHNVKISLLSPKVESKRPAQKAQVKTAYSELLRARSTSNTQKQAKSRATIKATPIKPQVGHLANLLATLRGSSVQAEETVELKARATPMVVVSLKGAKAKF